MIWNIVEITVRVGMLIVDRGRKDPIPQRQDTGDELDCPGSGYRVPNHRFGGTHRDLISVATKNCLDGLCFDPIVHRSRGSMGIDVVDLIRRE